MEMFFHFYELCVSSRSLLLVAIASLTFLVKTLLWRKGPGLNLPPGPKPWPVIGNLLQLGSEPHKTLTELTTRYGPLVFFKLGSQPFLITSDPATIREIMKVQDLVFSSRPQTICGKHLTYGFQDLIMAPHGDHWRTMRRISVTHLLSPPRLKSYASMRRNEVREMVEGVKVTSRDCKEVMVRSLFESFAMNIISDMILGQKWFRTSASGEEVDDHMLHLFLDSFHLFGALNISDYIPWLAPLDLQGYQKKVMKMHKELDESIQAVIEEHREARNRRNVGDDENRSRRQDFIEVLLELPGENGEPHLDDVTIKAQVLSLMWSTLDVPVNIAEWVMAELVCHPEIQQKLQAEIDEVVGIDRPVQESDLPNLRYLKCVVKECFRMHPSGPFGVPRMNMVPTKVAGYDIPAFTQVMVSHVELGMSSSIWPHDAGEFRPERWDPSQPLQDPEFRVYPFGVGRRSCAGEALGTSMVLLGLASLAQAFDWGPEKGKKREDIDMRTSLHGVMPMQTPLKAIATLRRELDHTLPNGKAGQE